MDNITEIAKDLISASTSNTAAGKTLQGSEIAQTIIDAQRAQAVSMAVVEIIKLSTIDESLMFCIGLLTLNDSKEEPYLVKQLSADSRARLFNSSIELISQQGSVDALLKVKSFSFEPSKFENVISAYADTSLAPSVLRNRMQNLFIAMKNAKLGDTRGDLGPVDKLDSQSVRDVIQDSFCGGYLGAVADGGCRVGIL